MEGMSKTVVVGSMAWAMLLTLASGTAWAAIECTAGSACRGTDGPNTMYGSTSEDRIYGKGGSDVIDAMGGRRGLRWGRTRRGAFRREWAGPSAGRRRAGQSRRGFRRRHDAGRQRT